MQKSYKWKVVTAFAVATLVLAGCSSSSDKAAEETATDTASEEAAPASTGPLKIGSLLPETGNLAFLGPPEFAGVDLAVKEINDAGGVLGQPVEHIRGDSGDTSTDIAQQTADSHIAAGVGAIVGAASSGVSLTVIDKITGAGISRVATNVLYWLTKNATCIVDLLNSEIYTCELWWPEECEVTCLWK